MSSQHHDPNRKENYDSNRPAFLIIPPLLSKKPLTKEQVAAEHAFDNFDGAGVASSNYAPSISSSVYSNQDADQPYSQQDSYRLPPLPANSPSKLAFDRPSSINVVTPTTSSFHSSSNPNSPQKYPSSPAPSATVAALASASARTPLKIKSVRMVESSQNPPTPLETTHNLVSNDPRSLNYQQVPPTEVMRNQDGFPVGTSIRSLAGTSVYDAQSAVQGNIDDDDDEEGNDAYNTDNIYQYDTNHNPPSTEKGYNPYKSPISTVHTPPLLNSTTSFDVNGNPVNSTINHVPNEYASTNSDSSSYIHVTHSNANSTGSSFQNVSVGSANDAKQSQNLYSSPTTQENHHYKQIIASENSSEAQLPHILDNEKDDAIPLSSYYYDKNFNGVDIANDPTPYPPQHVLKQYRPDAQPDLHGHEGEDLQSMKPRTTTHPTLNTNRDFIPNQHKTYPDASSAPHSHSKSISSSYSSASLESAGEEHHAHHNHSSVASIASSAILDSSGGIYKVSEPGSVPGSHNVSRINLVQNDSARNSTDNVSVYSEVSNATVRGVNLPSSNVDGDPNNAQNTQNIVPRAIVQGPTQGAQSGGYEAPLNTNEESRRMVSRTNELLLKRQASGGPQQFSAATVNIADNFKNDHIAAPVIVDEVTGEPLVFYPASIPVELKLPPLLSKKNQMKVQAMKAKASARQNRPKTFAIPPPPVWTVDPTIVPENLQEQRRSSVGSSSMLLNRRQSLGAMSVMTDATTTIKIKRRRSSAGTLSVFDMNAPDKQNRSSANLDSFGNEMTKDKQKGKKHEELPQISITRKSFIEDDDYNEEIDTNDKEEKDVEKKEETEEKEQSKEGEPNVIRLGHRKKKSSVSFTSGTSSDHNTNVTPDSELNVSKIRKSHARKASAVSKMSYIDGDDAWDDGEEEFEEYEDGGQADGEYKEEDIGNDSELIETGHFLNDEIGSDCATLPSDDEYQEEVLASDEEEEDPEKNGAIGNDRSVDDFAFTSFDPNAPITERGLLGGSIAYSSGIFPSVGIQPQTLVEELELRKAERKARVQKVYYDTVTGNAIAADMYGRREPEPDQLVRLQSSGHPLDERHNKSLLELQEIAKMNYSEDLQVRRNVQNAHEIERQMYRYGGVNGSKAVLSQFGLLNGTGNGESELLEEKPNETLKERRARLKKLKKEQEQAQAELAAYNSISMEGEGGLPDDEEEPPGETLAERRARLKKKKKMKRDQAKKVGESGLDGAVKDETQSLLEKNDSLVSGHQMSEQMPLMGNGITA